MLWARKVIVYLLSIIFLIALLGGAEATSAYVNLSKPTKVEAWLKQSKFYDHFVSAAIDQAHQSSNDSANQSGGVSLSDTVVQQAAQSAFSTRLLQQDVNTVLASNYAWLEGKTATPDFQVNLTAAKENFIEQVSTYVQNHVASLPVCTTAQLAQINPQDIDPLTITCRPPGVDAQAEAAQVAQSIQSSGFLTNPVITASNINPNQTSQSKPYYQKLSALPKVYRYGVKLPWLLGIISVLSALGIVFIAQSRRKGWRRVGIVLTEAGVILVVSKLIADAVFKQVQKVIFNNSNVGQLQQSLTVFLHQIESQLVKINLYFGIAYLVLAVIIFFMLTRNRRGQGKAEPVTANTQPQPDNRPGAPAVDDSGSGESQPSALSRTDMDRFAAAQPKTVATSGSAQPPRRKPPRLIQ